MKTNSGLKRSRATVEQLNQLVDYMQQNSGLAGGKFQKLHGKAESDKKWSELAGLLNSLGGAVKSIEQWRTVWRDLKSRTSLKVRDRKRQQALTGNRPISDEPITELERRVIDIIGTHYIEEHEAVAENVPMEEYLQVGLEDGDEITIEKPTTSRQSTGRESPGTPRTPARRTPRASKRRRDDSENDLQSKFLEIAGTQAAAMKLLAESNAAIVQGIEKMGEALTGIVGEGLKANAEAMNNFASAINGFITTNP